MAPMPHSMTIAPDNAMVRLRRLYRDANHCEPQSNQLALSWALAPERWAEHQIRYRNWSWHACEATIRACRHHTSRLSTIAGRQGLTVEQLVDTLPSTSQGEQA
jgi:hypothetical protein